MGPLEQSNTPNYNSNEEMDLTVTASLDNESIVLINREIINLATIQDSKSNKQEISINSSIKSDIKNETIKIPKDSDPVPEANTLSLLSFIIAILSIVFISIGGFAAFLLALISIPFSSKHKEEVKKEIFTIKTLLNFSDTSKWKLITW